MFRFISGLALALANVANLDKNKWLAIFLNDWRMFLAINFKMSNFLKVKEMLTEHVFSQLAVTSGHPRC